MIYTKFPHPSQAKDTTRYRIPTHFTQRIVTALLRTFPKSVDDAYISVLRGSALISDTFQLMILTTSQQCSGDLGNGADGRHGTGTLAFPKRNIASNDGRRSCCTGGGAKDSTSGGIASDYDAGASCLANTVRCGSSHGNGQSGKSEKSNKARGVHGEWFVGGYLCDAARSWLNLMCCAQSVMRATLWCIDLEQQRQIQLLISIS